MSFEQPKNNLKELVPSNMSRSYTENLPIESLQAITKSKRCGRDCIL